MPILELAAWAELACQAAVFVEAQPLVPLQTIEASSKCSQKPTGAHFAS